MPTNYELPAKIEKLLKVISLDSKKNEDSIAARIIANGKLRIEENYSYDNWDGGTYGHALHFTIPENIFIEIIKNKEKYSEYIRKSINNLKTTQNEYIQEVFFELSEEDLKEDWRQKLAEYELPRKINVIDEDKSRLWGVGGLKVFMSHKTEYKKETAELKEALKGYGISCFVAHEDIEATQEWQNEIENALFSMDVLVALLTSEFHNSNWTDQEVGVAIGRQIPIISVRLGKDPYGFIGKFQAVKGGKNLHTDLLKIFVSNKYIKPKMIESYIQAIIKSDSYSSSDKLAIAIPYITSLTENEIDYLIKAYNENSQVHDSWSFNGERPNGYGIGILPIINKNSSSKYIYKNRKIVKVE